MDELQREIDAYRDEHWGEILADIEALVKVESVEDLASAREGAPFGPGPRAALDAALGIAARMGLDIHDCDGYIGYADLVADGGAGAGTPGSNGSAGASDAAAPAKPRQIGIIGHVDVVPAGPGWTVEPYAITRRDGYLLGRGVIDDKGPLVVALHAVKFWKDRRDRLAGRNAAGEVGEPANAPASLPFTVRVLFGANEETNMKDVEYYRERFADPDFLFTPDNRFPLGYGESGICSGTLASGPICDGHIVKLEGGQAVNAVPGEARALVRKGMAQGRLDVSAAPTSRTFEAHGVSAHASTPELGENAIGALVGELLEAGIGNPEERAFLELLRELHADTSGAQAGVACADEHFGPLTMVGGVISLEPAGGKGADAAGEGSASVPVRICQSLDFRYPTSTTAVEIEQRVSEWAARMCPGATFTMEHDKAPFLMNPDSPEIRALMSAYRQVTGDDRAGETSKGGTYARCFTTGVSFGAEKPWESAPDWVGGMHGPDEGVREDLLKEAFSIYARALGNLAECDS